jgi:hypothetical protein
MAISVKELVLTETAPATVRLMTALGAAFTSRPLSDIVGPNRAARPSNCAVILSEDDLITAARMLATGDNMLGEVLASYSRVLILPFAATSEGLQALGQLVGAHIRKVDSSDRADEYVVHGSRDMCGPFAGLRFKATGRKCDHGLIVKDPHHETDFVATAAGAGLLTRFKIEDREVFVSSCAEVFDVTTEHRENLNATECFSSLVPLLFFIRHIGTPILHSPSLWANWIIDDPNLKPQYGFLSIKDLADSVGRMRAAATIAFIPWNHARTSPKVVQLFRAHWPRLAICMHGCDHTRSEFSTRSVPEALQMTELAVQRMRDLEARTSLAYERVMVFPQGRFSRMAMTALRHSELLSAVNTELVDCETGEGVAGGELLRPAIMSYSGFPLFMRRPPDAPLANFALDLLLGKPCLIVTHHDYFHNGMDGLNSTVEALNRLDPNLRWTNLASGIASTHSVRRNPDSTVLIRMFSGRSDFRLRSSEQTIRFTKAEPLPTLDVEVRWNKQLIPHRSEDGELTFTAPQSGVDPTLVEVKSVRPSEHSPFRPSTKQRLKVAARRYLSELRDNYIDRSPRIKAGLMAMKKRVSRAK